MPKNNFSLFILFLFPFILLYFNYFFNARRHAAQLFKNPAPHFSLRGAGACVFNLADNYLL